MTESTVRRLAAVVTVLLVTVACGSTNRPGDVEPVDAGDLAVEDADPGPGATTGRAGTTPPSDAPTATTTDGGEPATATSPHPDGAAGTTAPDPSDGGAADDGATGGTSTTAGGEATAGDDGAAATGGDSAPASAGGPIEIGFQISKDINEAFAAVGASNTAPSARRIVEALVDWVNANGGLGGRELVPVIHETDPISGTWSSQAQAACATFTEDHDVFAVLSSPVGGSNAMLACTSAKGVPLFEQNLWPYTQAAFEQHRGLLYQPGKMTADRWIPAWADLLVEEGFFGDDLTSPNQVGLVRFDAAHFDRLADEMLKPALAEHGAAFADEVEISTVRGAGDFGRMNSEINNAIIRFRSRGIDHVVFLEWNGVLPFFWHPQSDSQGYRPRYAYNSQSIPATIARESSASQLAGAIGASWTPPNDVPDTQHPGGNPAWDLCMQIMLDAGVNAHEEGYYTMSRCDNVFLLKQAMDQATDHSVDGLRRAVEGLGESFVSPHTFGPTRFGPGRYAGAVAVQQISYDEGCGCFAYVGERRPVP